LSLPWRAVPILLLAGWGAQALLARPLTHGADVRAARQLRTPPSSLALRLGAGGVRLAAADALWLTVLPKLGQSWAEPGRKAAWIEAAADAMVDAHPRATLPAQYCAQFLERIEKRHPGIERIVLRALGARRLRPFGRMEGVNEASWELPELLGMNLFLYGGPEGKAASQPWIERAARQPGCPLLLIDFYAALRAREGRELDGWDVLRHRAEVEDNRDFREYFLSEADGARRGVLQKWAERAEKDLGRFPGRFAEVAAGASPADREALRSDPGRFDRLREGVVVHPEDRWVEIPSLTELLIEDAGRQVDLLAREFEARRGRPPLALKEIEEEFRTALPPPPRPGTRWEYDAGTGALRAVR